MARIDDLMKEYDEKQAPEMPASRPRVEQLMEAYPDTAPPPLKVAPPVLSEYGDLAAQPWFTSTREPAIYAPVANLTTVAGVRNALAPEPGYVRPGGLASVLPFAFKETAPGSGEIVPGAAGYKFDPGGPINALISPVLDMLEGTGLASSVGGPNAPLAGKVSPEATAFLLGNRIGNPSRNALQFGPPEARIPSAGDLRAAPLSPEFTASPLTAEAKATALNQASVPEAPATQTGIPIVKPEPAQALAGGAPSTGPQSGGAAATPAYEAIHTPAEEAAYRATAEGQKLMEGQRIGEPDVNQYIPGETANSAEREQTVKAARELKELGIRVPEASQIDKAAAESNNDARRIYAENTAKGPVEIANEVTKRQSDIEADKAKVFAPENIKGPVDIKPVIEHMEATLAEPFNRQNTAMKEAYRPWLERLKAIPDGVIENPEEAWGLRYDIDQQTDKFATRDNPNAHRVANRLNTAADVLDHQIEAAAPGYDQMLGRYKEHSRAIDEMTVLQGVLKNLRGPGQNLTYNDFQRFMKNVVDSRMTPSTDLNPYKSISDENMLRLWNLRDSLRRTASAKELARAAGSDTMPNIIDALKAIGKMGGEVGLHAVTGSIFGPGGNVALQVLGPMAKGLNDRRMISRATRQMHRLMNPSEPLRVPVGQENPLVSPGP